MFHKQTGSRLCRFPWLPETIGPAVMLNQSSFSLNMQRQGRTKVTGCLCLDWDRNAGDMQIIYIQSERQWMYLEQGQTSSNICVLIGLLIGYISPYSNSDKLL